MKKTNTILMLTAVFVVVFAAACGAPAAPDTQPVAPAVDQPVQQQPAADTQSVPAGQSFAPACQAATSCGALDIADTEANTTYCVKKIPYQNISAPSGTIFEPQDPSGELKCSDTGTVVDGQSIFTCTGKELWTYELKVTNAACGGGGSLQAGTTSCADGQGYDAANNCCAPLNTGAGGSVTIKVNMGGCPLPQ